MPVITTTVTDAETPTTTAPTVTTSPGAQFGGGVRRTFRKSSENFHRNPLHSYFQQEVTQSAGKKRFSERQTPGSRQIETDFRAVLLFEHGFEAADLQNSFPAACGLRFYAATGGAFGNVPANARSLLLRSRSLRPRGVGSLSVLSSSNQAESDARSNTFTATHEIAVAISWPAHPHMRRIPQFRRRVPAATSEHRPPLCS